MIIPNSCAAGQYSRSTVFVQRPEMTIGEPSIRSFPAAEHYMPCWELVESGCNEKRPTYLSMHAVEQPK
jgi:hypothetical protein